jgi:hypothetical protein
MPIALEDPGCERVDAHAISRLPDGRVGFAGSCLPTADAGIPSANRIFVAAADPADGEVERLLEEPLGFNPHQLTWDPALTEGFASTLSDLCGSIAGLTRTGPYYPDIEVADEDYLWNLSDYFLDRGQHCDRYGRADWPAWSPDGASVAFFASGKASANTDFDRANTPWALYLMSALDQDPAIVLDRVLQPRGLVWSSDGRLAFSGHVIDEGDGIWTFDPRTGDLRRVTTRPAVWIGWSPDGSKIAGIVDVGASTQSPARAVFVYEAPKMSMAGRSLGRLGDPSPRAMPWSD